MSLAEAITDIANDLEKEIQDKDVVFKYHELKFLIRELRCAIKASNGSVSVQSQQSHLTPEQQHILEIEKAKQEFRKLKHKESTIHEERDSRFALCEGGNSDGTSVPIAVDMPVGAKVMVDGQIYQLRDGSKLQLFEEPKPITPQIIVP